MMAGRGIRKAGEFLEDLLLDSPLMPLLLLFTLFILVYAKLLIEHRRDQLQLYQFAQLIESGEIREIVCRTEGSTAVIAPQRIVKTTVSCNYAPFGHDYDYEVFVVADGKAYDLRSCRRVEEFR